MKFDYAPGLPGYGTKGVDGSIGLTGLATYFSAYDGTIETITIKSKLIANKILFQTDELLPGYPSRVYQTGDQFIDRNGKVFKIDFDEEDKYINTGIKLNTTGFFSSLKPSIAWNFERYSNSYSTDKFLIDVVYSNNVGDYTNYPQDIYGIEPEDFAQVKYTDLTVGSYYPFTVFTKGLPNHEDSFAIVRESAANRWHIGNLNSSGTIRDVKLSLDFNDISINSNVTINGSTTFYGNSVNIVQQNFNVLGTGTSSIFEGLVDISGNISTNSAVNFNGISQSVQSYTLYYDNVTGNVTYNTNPSIIVTAYTNGVDNRILTSSGASSINGEANLTFDGNTLTMGILGTDKTITILPVSSGAPVNLSVTGQAVSGSGPTGGNLTIQAGSGSTTSGGSGNSFGGNTYIIGGSAKQLFGSLGIGSGGDVEIYGGIGNDVNGDVYIANIGSSGTNVGQALFGNSNNSTNPTISFNADTGTGIYRSAAGNISISSTGIQNFLFDVSTFHARGNVVANSGSLSDKRLKTNIVPIQDSLNKVLELRGIEYDDIDGNGHHTGFIAQEVEKIIPEVILETKPIGKDTNYKAIRYTELIPYLSESIKELKKIIDEQQIEINYLKNKIK